MAGAAHCSLRAKRLLLDPKFEGYKLSPEPPACYQLGLDAGEERGWVRRRARRGGVRSPGLPFALRPGRPLGQRGRVPDPSAFPSVLLRRSAARPSGPGCKRALRWGSLTGRPARLSPVGNGERLRGSAFRLDFSRYSWVQCCH